MEPEWDQLSIETPEMVDIELPVAGIGSRFVTLLIDYLIWLAFLLVLIVIVVYFAPSAESASRVTPNASARKWAIAILIFIPFMLFWGYFTLFEAFWNGQTPGKRIARIRVIQKSGRGIGLFESMTRNLLRFVDQFPILYGVGVFSIFLTRQSQRLGDLAAGTLVVHERDNLVASRSETSNRTFTAGLFDAPQPPIAPPLPSFDLPSSTLQRLNASDLELLEGFFARRLDFTIETRTALAERIAAGLRAKMGIPHPPGISTELFLEDTARQLRDLVRIS